MKKNTVVHCKTQEEWDAVTLKAALTWSAGKWEYEKEETCIDTLGGYSNISYFRKYPHLYNIIPASEYLYSIKSPLIFN